MGAKRQKTNKTMRNTEFNEYTRKIGDVDFTWSINDITATKTKANIKLVEYNDYIKTTTVKIADDAAKNDNLKSANVYIDTGFEKDTEGKIIEKDLYIFGEPERMVLDNRQQYNNCGVESSLNTLVTAGIMTIKDQDKTETSFLKSFWQAGLAQDSGTIGKLDVDDGGTMPYYYRYILGRYGVDAKSYFIDGEGNEGKTYGKDDPGLKELGYLISQGHGAIIGVCSKRLWGNAQSETGQEAIDHAIAITGVVYDKENPVYDPYNLAISDSPVGFYVHDTGAWMTRYISLEEFILDTLYNETETDLPSLSGKTQKGLFIAYTTDSIKSLVNNLNATGDKNDNTIFGNSGDNTIKGMGGNDTLYGEKGNDKIYGGDGNDTIYGNGYFDGTVIQTGVSEDIKGNNTIDGGNGNDTIHGGYHNDFIKGGNGNDTIYGYNGIDAIYGGKGNDEIHGGDGNDYLLGESGNDTIDGGEGSDTISGGDGNDTLNGGEGGDLIETGKGNDTVVFDTKHGSDMVMSAGGSTTLQYDYAEIADLTFELKRDDKNSKIMNLKITEDTYVNPDDPEDTEDRDVQFNAIYNTKKNSTKSVTVKTGTGEQCENYKVLVTNAKKAKVADTSTSGNHKNINNILFSTSLKSNTITTSKKNDLVYMMDAMDKYNTKDAFRTDKITYTGGKDVYYSLAGDTKYVVNSFDDNTALTIVDSMIEVTKAAVGPGGEEIEVPLLPSTNDSIYFNSKSDDMTFFFDITKTGKTSNETILYTMNKSDDLADRMVTLASGEDADGTVVIAGYFGEDKTISGSDFYGNGRIEEFYTKEDGSYKHYNIESRINFIQEQVTEWFTTYETLGYDRVVNALQGIDDHTSDAFKDLVACYTTQQA